MKYLFEDSFILENYKIQDIQCMPLGKALHKIQNIRRIRMVNNGIGDKGLSYLFTQVFLPFQPKKHAHQKYTDNEIERQIESITIQKNKIGDKFAREFNDIMFKAMSYSLKEFNIN